MQTRSKMSLKDKKLHDLGLSYEHEEHSEKSLTSGSTSNGGDFSDLDSLASYDTLTRYSFSRDSLMESIHSDDSISKFEDYSTTSHSYAKFLR